MKYLVHISITMLFALAAGAQQLSFPLGHHVHQFQRKAEVGKVTSQGWDPTYSNDAEDEAAKERMVANIPTYPVGLPGSLEPVDLGNTGCPVDTTIKDAGDVAGLPTVSLPGVSGPVYLISDCDGSGNILRVQNGMKVAVWGSAFRQVVGVSSSGGEVWIVDSLINANANDNAGISCLGDTPCRVMYSEVLGGDDVMKMNSGDTCFRSHLHGYDRDSTAGDASGSGEHNDGVQINPGGDFTVINCNVEGPWRTSNAPLFAGVAGRIHNWRVADTLASGGTNGYKLGSKDATEWQNAVFLNSMLLGDAQGVSWGTESMGNSTPCSLGGGSSHYSGEGNTASNGAKTGTDQQGRSWDFDDSCNRNGVSAGNKAFFESEKQKLEAWTQAIRAAAGAPTTPPSPTASITVTTVPTTIYSASSVTVSATVTGCDPSLYRFECGDTPGAFNDKSSVANFHICGTMAPGNYTVGVLAQGGTCENQISKQIGITVKRPPAPVLQ